jgi:group I intron endonuclease
MKKGVIYKIINPTGRVYIGKTINFKTRMNYYKNSKSDSQKIISNSIKKYGWKNHIVEILEECDYNLLNELEIKYIEKEKSFRGINIFGMNLTLGGDGCFGRIDNEEIRKKRGISI